MRSKQVSQIHSHSLSFLSAKQYTKTFGISHTKWERTNFYNRPWRTRGKSIFQNFWTNSNVPSNQMRKLSVRIRWWPHRTTVGLLCHHKMYRYWCKQNTQSTSWCYASIHFLTWPLTQHRGLHQVPERISAALDWKDSCWKILHLAKGLHTMPPKLKNLVLTVRKFLHPHHS